MNELLLSQTEAKIHGLEATPVPDLGFIEQLKGDRDSFR